MDNDIQNDIRNNLISDLSKMPNNLQVLFKLMFGMNDGRICKEVAMMMDLNEIVDIIPESKLELAVCHIKKLQEDYFKKTG